MCVPSSVCRPRTKSSIPSGLHQSVELRSWQATLRSCTSRKKISVMLTRFRCREQCCVSFLQRPRRRTTSERTTSQRTSRSLHTALISTPLIVRTWPRPWVHSDGAGTSKSYADDGPEGLTRRHSHGEVAASAAATRRSLSVANLARHRIPCTGQICCWA